MEQGLSELVQLWIEAYNDRDFEAMAALADPRIEWVVAREHPAATTHRGTEAILSYLEDWGRTLPGMTYVSDEIVERGDRVLTVGRLRGSGSGSGAEVDVRIATISTFAEGRAVRVEEFLDPEEAKSALTGDNSPRNEEGADRPPK